MKYLLSFLSIFTIACGSNTDSSQLTNLQDQLDKTKLALSSAQNDETQFIHTVFFWIKEDAKQDEVESFTKVGLKDLSTIKSIYKSYVGPPAETPRDVVDNSYGVALVVHFKSKADHEAYQEDPIHLKMIEDYKHLWERVQVYDNLLYQ